MNNDSLWDHFEAEVETTKQLDTRYFSVQFVLAVAVANRTTAAQSLERVYTVIREALNDGLQGLRYVIWMKSSLDERFDDISELEMECSTTPTGAEVFTVPVVFQVIGKDQSTAMARFISILDWLEAVDKETDDFAGIKWTLTKSSGKLLNGTDITLSPIIQVVNFPNAKFWALSNENHKVDKDAVDEYVRWKQRQAYTIRTDSVHEAVAAIETTDRLLTSVIGDSYQWRWVIQSLHSTLQSFMVAALQGSDPSRVLEPINENNGTNSTAKSMPKLKGFLSLYDDIKHDALMLQFTHSQVFKPEGSQGGSVKELNRLRNDFTHFIPRSLIIYPDELFSFPRLVRDILDVVEFLAFESNNVPWNHNYSYRRRTKEAIQRLRLTTEMISETYAKKASDLDYGANTQKFRLRFQKRS